MFAVIRNNNKQYKIEKGKKYKIDSPKEKHKEGEKIVFTEVLLFCDGDKVEIGTPVLIGAEAIASVVGTVRERKIVVNKFHSKKRYARTAGERPEKLLIEIEKISMSKPEKKSRSQKMSSVKTNEK